MTKAKINEAENGNEMEILKGNEIISRGYILDDAGTAIDPNSNYEFNFDWKENKASIILKEKNTPKAVSEPGKKETPKQTTPTKAAGKTKAAPVKKSPPKKNKKSKSPNK